MNDVEILEEARARIADRGRWYQGNFSNWAAGDDRRLCALGSLMLGDKTLPAESIERAISNLYRASHELYGLGVYSINDDLGHSAVLHCYDLAIKNAKAALED